MGRQNQAGYLVTFLGLKVARSWQAPGETPGRCFAMRTRWRSQSHAPIALRQSRRPRMFVVSGAARQVAMCVGSRGSASFKLFEARKHWR